MKKPVTVEAVTHTHTHTDNFINKKINVYTIFMFFCVEKMRIKNINMVYFFMP